VTLRYRHRPSWCA